VTPIYLEPIISKMDGDMDLVTIEHLQEMAPGVADGYVTSDIT